MPTPQPPAQNAKERLATTIHLIASLSQAMLDSKILRRPAAPGTRPHLTPDAAANLEIELAATFLRHFPGITIEFPTLSQSTLPTPAQSRPQRRSNHTRSTRHR